MDTNKHELGSDTQRCAFARPLNSIKLAAPASSLLIFIFAGCSTLPTGDGERAQIQANLSTVVYSDGINEKESQIIADAYLDKHMAASFGHIGPYDGEAAWIFKITGDIVPFELTNVPPVLVNKTTGVVTWEAKPPLKI